MIPANQRVTKAMTETDVIKVNDLLRQKCQYQQHRQSNRQQQPVADMSCFESLAEVTELNKNQNA